MKTSLVPGLLNNIKLNANLGQDSIKLFEMRPVFSINNEKICESKRLSGIMYGSSGQLSWTAKPQDVDFYDVKGICEALLNGLGIRNVKFTDAPGNKFLHPQSSARMLLNGKEIGVLGLLHPSIVIRWELKKNTCVFNFAWDALAASVLESGTRRFKTLEQFPTVRRDVAILIAEDVSSERVIATVESLNSKFIKSVVPFDVYKGKGIPEGRKSMAYAVLYYNPEKTLTDEEVNGEHAKLVRHLKEKLGAEIR